MRALFSFGSCLLLLLTATAAASSDPSWQKARSDSAGFRRLTILYTNDLKGRLQPGRYFDETRGGMARLAHLLKRLDPNGEALIVDGGDALGPDQMAHFDAGRLFARLMDRAGYAALVPGNHDLNYGPDTLRARASDVRFHFLAANLVDDNGDPVVTDHVVIDRGGIRILLTGLLSPAIAKVVNPTRTRGIEIVDPGQALSRLLEERERGKDFDVVLALAHMPPLEVLELARAFPQVELFIAGDNPVGATKGASISLVELAGGTRIASAPEKGAFLGRLDMTISGTATTGMVVSSITTELIPLDATNPEDPDILGLIAAHEAAYRQDRAEEIGTISVEITDFQQFVSDLMRDAMRTEVSFINEGALRPVTLSGRISKSEIDSLLRFDDTLVRLDLSGEDLMRMAASSNSRSRAGQRLVFSGFDPEKKTVNGILLQRDEHYTTAATSYLAGGGDGYVDGDAIDVEVGQDITLGEIVSSRIRSHANPLASLESALSGGSSWKAKTKLSNSLTLTSLNNQAAGYTGVSQISGRDAMAWNALLNTRLSRVTARGSLTLDLKSSFGQVREQSRFKEAADRLDADLVYALQGRKPAPFAAISTTTVWTAPEGDKHPITIRGSSGLQSQLGSHGALRLGLGLERDQVAETNQIGLEVVPEYERKLGGGNGFSSHAKLFLGATETRKVSVQQYNSLTVNLAGNLHLTVEGNLFFHWNNEVRERALKSELQVGLGYVWSGKRSLR